MFGRKGLNKCCWVQGGKREDGWTGQTFPSFFVFFFSITPWFFASLEVRQVPSSFLSLLVSLTPHPIPRQENLSPIAFRISTSRLSDDGNSFIIIVLKKFVQRWSPKNEESFREMGNQYFYWFTQKLLLLEPLNSSLPWIIKQVHPFHECKCTQTSFLSPDWRN